MNELLQKAIDKLMTLPADEQEFLALLILEELEDMRIWADLFSKSQGKFSKLAAWVIEDDDAGLTDELDPDELPD